MGKVFLSVGHNENFPGACNKEKDLVEFQENQKVCNIIPTLKTDLEIELVPVGSLVSKIEYINQGAKTEDITLEVHFNYFTDEKINGYEVLYYPRSIEGRKLATSMINTLGDYLPLRSRGLFFRSDLGFLSRTKIPAIIVEPLYLSNDLDSQYLFYPRGHLIIAKAIIEGLKTYMKEEEEGE